jgi:predicted nucleic acid-binding protein
MVKLLLDTMAIVELLSRREHRKLAIAIDEGKIHAIVATISLTEIYKIVGIRDERKAREMVTRVIASRLELVDVDAAVARKAGELRLHYSMPTADSLIAATGIIAGAKHVLTEDKHFQTVKALIKPVDSKQAHRMFQ